MKMDFPIETGVVLTYSKLKTLNEVNNYFLVKFDGRIGGIYYVTVDHKRVDLRKWWMADNGVLKPCCKSIYRLETSGTNSQNRASH